MRYEGEPVSKASKSAYNQNYNNQQLRNQLNISNGLINYRKAFYLLWLQKNSYGNTLYIG